MENNLNKKRSLLDKLVSKYRLVILNENTFEEQVSFKLSRLNVLILLFLSAFILVFSSLLLIAFTSLREYIPGYASTKLTNQANNLVYKTDSLLLKVNEKERFYQSIKKVLKGELKAEKFNIDSTKQAIATQLDETKLKPSAKELALRKEVDKIEKYSIQNSTDINSDYLFFPPVKGKVISRFDFEKRHFAIAISVPKNTPVKAASAGMVVFSDWAPETGYFLVLRHKSGLISVYKQNSKLLKQQGEFVIAGEVIAVAGFENNKIAEEKSTEANQMEAQLRFELWDNDKALDPLKYIDFEK